MGRGRSTLRVALYGGAGSGKSTAAEMFAELGAPVIDADAVAKELTAPGSRQLAQIVAAFGAQIIGDAQLDRALLRRLIFADKAARMRLNAIMHPEIYRQLKARINRLQAPYCVVLMPLLREVDMMDLFDCIVVIDCPRRMQIERLKKRDGLSAAAATQIIDAQATRAQRLEISDKVIDNSLDPDSMCRQIQALDREWTLTPAALRKTS